MTKPRISVVLPSYNHARYVDACVAAFLRQTFQDFELIIIDDASSDDNVEQIRRFSDSRIRLVARQANRGVAAGMNEGFRIAKADLICFFATDDLPEPGYLEAVLRAFDANPSAVGVYFPLRKIGENGESSGSGSGCPSGQAIASSYDDHSWAATSCPRPAWLCAGRQWWKRCCPKASPSIRIGC